MSNIQVKFKQWLCIVEKHQYNNGRTALELVDSKDGEPVLRATVNIPDVQLAEDEVIIKNYSENKGILETLVGYKIISEPIRYTRAGFIDNVPICKLLI